MTLSLENPKLLTTKAYINGVWVDASDKTTFPVFNPATGAVIAHVANLGKQDTKKAVEAAETAFPIWSALPAKKRSMLLKKWFALILKNKKDLATIMTAEQGKPMAESIGEIIYGASFIEWFAEEAKRMYGDVIPETMPDRRQIAIRQAVGVVGAITPWNFPSAMITRKAAPALAAGCTFVCKSADQTPLSALALCVLAEEAGIPAGVINIITGTDAQGIGEILTEDPRIRKFTFTGSTAVGKHLLKQCASTIKKVSLELGGNAPVIVFDDADLDMAIDGLMACKYRNAGQTCISANRIMVQDTIHATFVEKLTERLKSISLGDGSKDGVTMGPLISEAAIERVDSMVKDALENGAKAVIGGKASTMGAQFYEPTILTHVTNTMRIFKEEIFGPIAAIYTFKEEADAIKMANDTDYGLAAYFYSRDIGRVWRVSEALEYGMIGANETSITSEVIPFGGIKQSGLGREGSKYGLDEFTEIKYICMGGL